MSNPSDIRTLEFEPLSEVKARLSEFVRKLDANRRVVITNNGKPSAVLLSYEDYVALLPAALPTVENNEKNKIPEPTTRTIDFEEWKKNRPAQRKVARSILDLFDTSNLSRKGQKSYKRETVSGFQQ